MLKTLTLSLSLAAALGVCSVSKAGGWFEKDDDVQTVGFGSPQSYGLSSSQCAKPSAQCLPSPQCGFKLHNPLPGICTKFTGFCSKLKPKPPCYTYEWVLKKKLVWSPPCIFPSSQCSPQGSSYGTYPMSTGQGMSSSSAPAPPVAPDAAATPAPTPTTGEAPKAPEVPDAAAPAGTPVPPAGGVAPPPPPPTTPAAPTARTNTGGLLFSSPAGY